MKKTNKTMALCGGLLAVASLPAQASVGYSVDSSTTTSQTSWSGSPASTLDRPNGASSVDGNVTDAILFDPSTSFTLGAFEFDSYNNGSSTYNIALYDIGSFTLAGAVNPVYTFTGSESDMLSSGLTTTFSATSGTFNILTFAGADQVALTAGQNYLLTFTLGTGNNLIFARGPASGSSDANAADDTLLLNSSVLTAPPTSGFQLDYVPAGAPRLPVGAFYAATPEPTSLALIGGGLVLLGTMRRFKK